MTVRVNVPGATEYVLQEAIGAYSDEAYTNAKKLSGTGIAGADAEIDTSTETFVGQLRWKKPLKPVINVASLTDPADGIRTTQSSNYAKYIKTVRTHGAQQVNMQQVVTQQDGLAKIGRDFAETRGQDEHDAILSVLKGVAISELVNGAASGAGATGLGGQTFDNDPEDQRYGMYVDMGLNKLIIDADAAKQGAARAEAFLQAMGMGWKDYEPTFAYLIVSPKVLASLRSANLVDADRVTDGQMDFETIFSGKFRLIVTRANQGLSAAERTAINTGAGIDLIGTETTFIVMPNSLAFNSLAVPVPVEVQRNAASYSGGGTTDVWYRWGYIVHPRGYSWNANEDAFASNPAYMEVGVGGDEYAPLAGATMIPEGRGAFIRKATSALSLGILPIFHS
jgi:hypothetical protein